MLNEKNVSTSDINDYHFSPNANDYPYSISGIIKNTDNGIFIMNGIYINSKIFYKIFFNKLIEKNCTIFLKIGLNEKLKNKDVVLIIEDLFGNKYKYLMELSLSKSSYIINGVAEITDNKNNKKTN